MASITSSPTVGSPAFDEVLKRLSAESTRLDRHRYWPWKQLRRWAGIRGGMPVFNNTGLSVDFVYSRWLAGESIAELALDYGLHPSVIEQGLREWSGRPRNWRQRVEIRPNLTAKRKRARR